MTRCGLLPLLSFRDLMRFTTRPSSRTRTLATLCALAVVGVATPVQAQDPPRGQTEVVVEGGLSLAGDDSVSRSGPGLAGHVGARHHRGRLVFSLRMGMNQGGSAYTTLPGGLRDRFDEIALMVGYALHRTQHSQAVLSTGVASVSGERVGTGPAPYFGTTNVPFRATVGVPVQLALSVPAGRSGLGMAVHANINPEEVFGAVTVQYLFGMGTKAR